MKKLIAATTLFTLVFLFGITGCSTIEGVGKDIQKGGKVIESTAKKY
ncbi:entericidin A/B family lipoprotein [Thiolapillus sp.]